MATTYKPKFLQNLKRTVSDAQLDGPSPAPVAKKPTPAPTVDKEQVERPSIQTQPVKQIEPSLVRFPALKHDPQRSFRRVGSGLDEAAIQTLLERSILLALEAIGFEGADTDAVEEFRENVEECE